MVQSILNWIFGWVGSFLLSAAVKFLESKWPGIKPVIDQILAFLGQNVPASVIQAHLNLLHVPKAE